MKKNHEHERMIISEEKIFGNEFVIIRKKYLFENYNKRNLLFNKKEQ